MPEQRNQTKRDEKPTGQATVAKKRGRPRKVIPAKPDSLTISVPNRIQGVVVPPIKATLAKTMLIIGGLLAVGSLGCSMFAILYSVWNALAPAILFMAITLIFVSIIGMTDRKHLNDNDQNFWFFFFIALFVVGVISVVVCIIQPDSLS